MFAIREKACDRRCPFCHDALGERVQACDGCGTQHHVDCASHAGRCTVLGCRQVFAPAAAVEPARRPRRRWRHAFLRDLALVLSILSFWVAVVFAVCGAVVARASGARASHVRR